jgi:PAS domain-containing protein
VSPAVGLPSTGSSVLADAAALGLQALAEALTRTEDGICVVDAGRRYVYANPAACQMLGYPVEQLRGRDFLGSSRPGTTRRCWVTFPRSPVYLANVHRQRTRRAG